MLIFRKFSEIIKFMVTVSFASLLICTSAQGQQEQTQDSGTSTDVCVMPGSDFVRPGLAPKANYNIGVGHTVGFPKKIR